MLGSVRFKNYVRESLWPVYRLLRDHYPGQHFYQNLNYSPVRQQKRVLISYITVSFEMDYDQPVGHTAKLEVPIIIKAFMDRDFVVDVIDCLNCDYETVSKRRYDVIFGFGRPWMAAVEHNPQSVAVMYLTECAPHFSIIHEQARLDYYAVRHGKKLSLTRSNQYFLDEHIKKARVGVILGNMHTAETYIRQFPLMKLRLLSPSGFRNKMMKSCPSLGDRHSFLWFGSWGAIHKGLDILLDVFCKIPEAKLYIAGLGAGEKWLLNDYRQYENIIDLGFLNVQSQAFLELMGNVSYCVLPSASEGMSTSVLTCMRHGLIPVITPSCGIDVEDYGYLIEDYHVEALSQLIRELMEVPQDELERKSQAVFIDANRRYSLEAFAEGMQEFVDSFVK